MPAHEGILKTIPLPSCWTMTVGIRKDSLHKTVCVQLFHNASKFLGTLLECHLTALLGEMVDLEGKS